MHKKERKFIKLSSPIPGSLIAKMKKLRVIKVLMHSLFLTNILRKRIEGLEKFECHYLLAS